MYFLSYSRSDSAAALDFADALKVHGLDVWVDQRQLRPSDHWDRSVERALESCEGLVILMSPASVASEIVADEVGFMLDRKKCVIPVLIETCTPPLRLRRIQYVDARNDLAAAALTCARVAVATREMPQSVSAIPRAQIISEAEKAELSAVLAKHVGPLASTLVERASKQHHNFAAAVTAVSAFISNREAASEFIQRFSKQRPADDKAPGEDAVDMLVRELTHFVGPVAAKLVAREQKNNKDFKDMAVSLAQMIPSDEERKSFLVRVGLTSN